MSGGSSADHATPADRRFGLNVATVAAVGLLIRVVYAVDVRWDRSLQYDGPAYRSRALFLRAGRSFTDPEAWHFRRVVREGAIHPPGNTLWVALGQSLGFDTDHSMMLWGCLLGTATIVVVGLLGREVGGPRVGLVAAAIAAVHPGLWSLDSMVMAESPAQFVTALLLLLAYRFWRQPSASRAAWMGAVAACGALVRSEMLVLLFVLVVPLCVAAPGTVRQAAAKVAAATLWAGLVLAPWVGWNLVRFEKPVTLATGVDISLAYTSCDDAWYGRHAGYWNVFCGSEITKDPRNHAVDESELGAQYRSKAGTYILDHKSRFPAVVAARVGRTLSVYHPFQQVRFESSREGRGRSVLTGGLWATWGAAALALVALRLPPRTRRHLLPLLAPLATGIAGAAITFGTSRYRAPGDLGLVVLAAVGVDALARLRTRRRDARRAAATDAGAPVATAVPAAGPAAAGA
jgi:hypothetical protein